VIAALDNIQLGQFLVDGIAPQIKRDSGYLRIVKLDENRVGDNAPLARIEFVDTLNFDGKPEVKEENPKADESAAPKAEKPAVKKEDK
jgi:hypothetical protein